jgi:hypothetical protein
VATLRKSRTNEKERKKGPLNIIKVSSDEETQWIKDAKSQELNVLGHKTRGSGDLSQPKAPPSVWSTVTAKTLNA